MKWLHKSRTSHKANHEEVEDNNNNENEGEEEAEKNDDKEPPLDLSKFSFLEGTMMVLGSVILTLSQVPGQDLMFPYIVRSYFPFVSEQFPFHFRTYHLITSFTIITSVHLVVSHLSLIPPIFLYIHLIYLDFLRICVSSVSSLFHLLYI